MTSEQKALIDQYNTHTKQIFSGLKELKKLMAQKEFGDLIELANTETCEDNELMDQTDFVYGDINIFVADLKQVIECI